MNFTSYNYYFIEPSCCTSYLLSAPIGYFNQKSGLVVLNIPHQKISSPPSSPHPSLHHYIRDNGWAKYWMVSALLEVEAKDKVLSC